MATWKAWLYIHFFFFLIIDSLKQTSLYSSLRTTAKQMLGFKCIKLSFLMTAPKHLMKHIECLNANPESAS